MFSTSVFRPGIDAAATSWLLWCRFPDENQKVFHYHYNFLFPKIYNIVLRICFLINKICSVCVNVKRSLKWWIFKNLQLVAWTEKKNFWSCVVHWSETAPCFLLVNSVRSWFNYFLRSGNYNTYMLLWSNKIIWIHFNLFLRSFLKTINRRYCVNFDFKG